MQPTFDQLPQEVGKLNERLDRLENLLLEIKQDAGSQKDEILDIKGAAAFLDLKPATLYSKVSRGEIPASKRGRKLIFSRSKLVEWSLQGERESISENRRQAIEEMQAARKKSSK
jgi:predicted DNA-binding transcriptional regulator AlpA